MKGESRPMRGGRRSSGEAFAVEPVESTTRVHERARAGDRSAAIILIERAAPSVRAWAHGKLPQSVRNDADTEDIVQDAVLRTLRRLTSFQHRTVDGMQAYLRASVINRIRDLLRASGRHGAVESLTDKLSSPLPSALEDAIRRESSIRSSMPCSA